MKLIVIVFAVLSAIVQMLSNCSDCACIGRHWWWILFVGRLHKQTLHVVEKNWLINIISFITDRTVTWFFRCCWCLILVSFFETHQTIFYNCCPRWLLAIGSQTWRHIRMSIISLKFTFAILTQSWSLGTEWRSCCYLLAEQWTLGNRAIFIELQDFHLHRPQ